MISCKAYILRERGVIPSLEDIEVDDNLLEGQVLVKVHYSGLCATQLEEIFASSRNEKYMPHLLGHEAYGRVVSVGSGVRSLQSNEECVVHWRPSSDGLDAIPGQYFQDKKPINAGKVVAFSTHVIVPENRVSKVPSGSFPEFIMPLLGCAFPTGWGSIVKDGAVRAEDHVLVLGLGGVGMFAAETALNLGVAKLIVVDPVRKFPKGKYRYSDLVYYQNLDEVPTESLKKITLAVDTTGHPELVQAVVDQVSRSARVVLVGMPVGNRKTLISTQRLLDGLRLIGSNGGNVDFAADLTQMMKSMSESNFTDDGLAIGNYHATELSLAIEAQRRGTFRRVILDFSNLD